MQLRNQFKGAKNWKVVASVAAASALGVSSLALAGENGTPQAPDSIHLDDKTAVTQVSAPTTVPTTVAEALKLGADTASVDSPFDGHSIDSVASAASANSPASPASPDSPNSPATPDSPASPASPVSPDTADSPASVDSPNSPATPDSPASPASPDSPDTPDSVDSQDSPGSADS